MATSVIVCGAAGRMGRTLVELIAQASDLKITGAVELAGHQAIGRDVGSLAGLPDLGVIVGSDFRAVASPDAVGLDFTNAAAAVEHLRIAVEQGTAMVVGSTGFTQSQQAELDQLAPRTRCVVSPNMSVGVAVLQRLVGEAAKALGPDFDPEIIEMHHRTKIDAPSGTALALARTVAAASGRDVAKDAVYGREGIVGQRQHHELAVLALRGGDVVGDHTVIFAGVGERLELTHRAQSRDSLARGALRAARWVIHQPVGRYSMHDVLGWH